MNSADANVPEEQHQTTSAAGSGALLRRLIHAQGATPTKIKAAATPLTMAQASRERAATVALGRTAEKLHRLPTYVEKVEFSAVSLSELAEILPEQALLAVVEGEYDELGVVAFCPNILTSLIEVQALGRVTSRPPLTRRPTRTDAMMSADFLNRLLAELDREVAEDEERPKYSSYRYATYAEDTRTLLLMLEDTALQAVTLSFRVGVSAQRLGTIAIVLPAPSTRGLEAELALAALIDGAGQDLTGFLPNALSERPQPMPSHAQSDEVADPVDLSAAVLDAPIHLQAILARKTFKLSALQNLKPGTTLNLSTSALHGARLETRSGQLVACGQLGEADGFHAIRVTQTASASLTDDQAQGTNAAPNGIIAAAELAVSDTEAPRFGC